jgi:hypothetical protein
MKFCLFRRKIWQRKDGLRREVRLLKEERDLLIKATVFLTQQPT